MEANMIYPLLLMVSVAILYSVMVPFLPIESQKLGIEEWTYGYLFSIFAVAKIITSLIVGKIMIKTGRKCMLISGVFLLGIGVTGFSVLPSMPNQTTMIIWTLILRIIQGVAVTMVQTTIFAIIATSYPDEKEKYIGACEGSMGVGVGLGAIIGGTLYSLLGFEFTFILLGAYYFLNTPISFWFIPSSVDSKKIEEQAGVEKSWGHTEINCCGAENVSVSYLKLLSNKVYLLTSISAGLSYFSYCFTEPVIAVRLLDFDLPSAAIGYFFGITPIGIIMGTLLVPMISKHFENRFLISIGTLLCGFSIFLIGPSTFLPDSLVLMIIGQFLVPFFSIFFFVVTIPEMIVQAEKIYPGRADEIADMSSGVMVMMGGVGLIIAPLYGSYMTMWFDFRTWGDSWALILISFSVLYFLLCKGHEVFKKPRLDPILLSTQSKLQDASGEGTSDREL